MATSNTPIREWNTRTGLRSSWIIQEWSLNWCLDPSLPSRSLLWVNNELYECFPLGVLATALIATVMWQQGRRGPYDAIMLPKWIQWHKLTSHHQSMLITIKEIHIITHKIITQTAGIKILISCICGWYKTSDQGVYFDSFLRVKRCDHQDRTFQSPRVHSPRYRRCVCLQFLQRVYKRTRWLIFMSEQLIGVWCG